MSKEENKKQEEAPKEELKKQEAQAKEAPKAEQGQGAKKEAPAQAKADKPEPKGKGKDAEEAPAKPKAVKPSRVKVTHMTLEQVEKELAETRQKMGADDQSKHAQNLMARMEYLKKYEMAGSGSVRKAA